MFNNKDKKGFDTLIKKLVFVNEHKLEICYFDNSQIGPVISGKLPLHEGWYVRQHGEKISSVIIDKPLHETYMEALNSVNQ